MDTGQVPFTPEPAVLKASWRDSTGVYTSLSRMLRDKSLFCFLSLLAKPPTIWDQLFMITVSEWVKTGSGPFHSISRARETSFHRQWEIWYYYLVFLRNCTLCTASASIERWWGRSGVGRNRNYLLCSIGESGKKVYLTKRPVFRLYRIASDLVWTFFLFSEYGGITNRNLLYLPYVYYSYMNIVDKRLQPAAM